jgi:6-pyruvoyltetrahydropterin/6-carboxytetrahydropterin synthase
VFETGASIAFCSFHIMPGAPPPEGERHTHDYRIDVVVAREELDERGMVVDLDVLGEVLEGLRSRLDGADLDQVILDAAAVTVEVFARWVHERVGEAMAGSGCDDLSVRVWESPIAFGGYRAPPT